MLLLDEFSTRTQLTMEVPSFVEVLITVLTSLLTYCGSVEARLVDARSRRERDESLMS